MQDFANIFGKRQNLINLLLLGLIALGLPIALYLATHQQVFRSQAGGGQAINFVSDNVVDIGNKTYIKPIPVTDPNNPESTQYRYQVTLSLQPPDTGNQTVLNPVKEAFAQSNQCTYSTTCNVPLTADTKVAGTTYCKYRDTNACSDGNPQDCFVSVGSSINGCGIDPTNTSADVSCKLQSSTIGLGQQATFKITYNSALAPLVQSAEFDKDGGDEQNAARSATGPGTPISGSKYEITLKRTYSTPYSGIPTAYLFFSNAKGATLPVQCGQLSVGASLIKANISGDTSLISGQTGQYSVTAELGNSDATLGLSEVQLFVLHADGSSLSNSECGNGTPVNGACRIYSNSNFQSLQKSFTKTGIKWTPVLPGASETDYYLYAQVVTNGQTSSGCLGRRGSKDTVPCSGNANLDVTVGTKSGYHGYAVATSIGGLNTPIVSSNNVSSWPQEVVFPPDNQIINDWQSPGTRTIYVKFLTNNGQDLVVNRTVELVPPDPQIRAVSCNLSADNKSLAVVVRGYDFGSQNTGRITLNGSALNVTQWKTNQSSSKGSDLIVGNLPGTSSSQNYQVELFRADGAYTTAQCSVGVTTLNLGAKIACRPPTAPAISNVDLSIADSFDVRDGVKGKVTKTKVTVSPDGTVNGLNSILQTCNYYKLSIKAPYSLRRDVDFQAADGSTVIPDFKLPIGDIFPTNGGDGKINSFDVAELLRQWSASPATVRAQSTATDSATTSQSSTSTSASGRSADFNLDGVVNSFDFACLVSSFNQESDPELTPGSVNTSAIGDFCASDDQTTNSSASPTVTVSTPSPTPTSTSPSSSAVITISPSPTNPVTSPSSATLKSLIFNYYPNKQTELNTANNFSGQIDLNSAVDQTTGSTVLSVVVSDSNGNIIGNKQAVKFIIRNYVRTNFSRDKSPYDLFSTCLPDSSVQIRWNKQADKRYKAVMFDCTNESTAGSCNPGVVVGSTEYSGIDPNVTATYIAEALPDGNTQKLASGGNYPGNDQYNVFQTQQNRRYSIQLYERELDNSNPHAISGIATPEFKCSNAKSNFVSPPTYTAPNDYGLEVACQGDGTAPGALWWTFATNGVVISSYDTFRAVAYDCTYDTTPDCSDSSKYFIAGQTQFSSIDAIKLAQPFANNGQVLITRPGHRYVVQLFARDPSGKQIVIDNATATVSCR